MGTDYNQITGTRIKGIHTGNIYIVGGEWVQVSQDSYGVVFEYKNYTIDYSELQTIIDSLPAGVCLGMINSNDSIYRTFYMSGIDNRFEKVTPNPSRVGYYHNNIPDPIPLPKLVFPFTYYSSYLEPEQ